MKYKVLMLSLLLLLQPIYSFDFKNAALKGGDMALQWLMVTQALIAAGLGGYISYELFTPGSPTTSSMGSVALLAMGSAFALWNGLGAGSLALNRYYDFSKHPGYVQWAARLLAAGIETSPFLVAYYLKLKEKRGLEKYRKEQKARALREKEEAERMKKLREKKEAEEKAQKEKSIVANSLKQ